MTRANLAKCLLAAGLCLVAACADSGEAPLQAEPGGRADQGGGHLFVDATDTHVPATVGSSMDAAAVDVDRDGDLDVVIAKEVQTNVLLLNDGTGRLTDASDARLPRTAHDSEDVAAADFDRDGDVDVVLASEDDGISEFYLNDGRGSFTDATDRLPRRAVSNSVIAADIDGDGDADLLFGNSGQDFVFVNGGGRFTDQTAQRLPADSDVTQDLEAGDVDGDGDLDLVAGNIGAPRLLLNNGHGFFTAAEAGRLPPRAGVEETREADLADVDGDGDLDLYLANIAFVAGAELQDRLLVNDGRGFFTDETAARIGRETSYTLDAELVDVDRDGDLDLVTANLNDTRPLRISLNDGAGTFKDATGSLVPAGITGHGVDVEVADFDGDGRKDIYLTNYTDRDRLLLARD